MLTTLSNLTRCDQDNNNQNLSTFTAASRKKKAVQEEENNDLVDSDDELQIVVPGMNIIEFFLFSWFLISALFLDSFIISSTQFFSQLN